jgi:hypothetical protein
MINEIRRVFIKSHQSTILLPLINIGRKNSFIIFILKIFWIRQNTMINSPMMILAGHELRLTTVMMALSSKKLPLRLYPDCVVEGKRTPVSAGVSNYLW